jgi:HD superfamily phosphohydrolase
MRTNKRIRTVLYGDERLSAAELEVIHTPAMQRLYGLKQLGLADRVYIDASHSRMHHVVGVLEQVNTIVDAIIVNLRRTKNKFQVGPSGSTMHLESGPLAQLVSSRRPVIRFIGLLHDLTHAPFGHTVEDEIRIVESKHDHPKRQAEAFYRLLCQLTAWLSLEASGSDPERFPVMLKPFLSDRSTPADAPVDEIAEALKGLLVTAPPTPRSGPRVSPKQIAEMFVHLDCAMTALTHLEVLHKEQPSEVDFPHTSDYSFQVLVRSAVKNTEFERLLQEYAFSPHRDAYMLDIVGNTVCADLLDYAARDSHYAALRLDYDPNRIAENFTLAQVNSAAYATTHSHYKDELKKIIPSGHTDPFEGNCLRTAISLVSHKYRADIPGELMNLLNVRYYVYERVIYHPTKSAAGAMLGTSLQLLGWRRSSHWVSKGLPPHLRFVGDDVFLHDIRSALDFVLVWMAKFSDAHVLTDDDLRDIANFDQIHNGIVIELLNLRRDQPVGDTRGDLTAAQLLLNGLAARRYLRPVYRALPSTKDADDARLIAQTFQDPDTRYETEREIEGALKKKLPRGTITIHCPPYNAGRKIANVFLTKPVFDPDGTLKGHSVHKLKHIAMLDDNIFHDHEAAVRAVEEMYASMWRLNVYAAPEQFHRYEEIVEAADRIINEKLKSVNELAALSNDPNLRAELDPRAVTRGIGSVDGYDLGPLGETLGRIFDEMVESGAINSIPPELYGSPDSVPAEIKSRIKGALITALANGIKELPERPLGTTPAPARTDKIVLIVKGYIQNVPDADIEQFRFDYGPRFVSLSDTDFGDLSSRLKISVNNSNKIDLLDARHRGTKLLRVRRLIDRLLAEYR